MAERDPSIVQLSVEKAHIWLKQIAEEFDGQDRLYAYRALRSVLHALRDALPVDVAAKLGAQLPTLIRGIYYEDWVPSRTPEPIHDVDLFLTRIAQEGNMAGETQASLAVSAVTSVMRRHLTSGEIEDVLAVLPESFRTLIT